MVICGPESICSLYDSHNDDPNDFKEIGFSYFFINI